MTKDFTIYQNGENISRFGQIDIHNCSNCNFETFILGLYPEIDGIGTGVVGLTDKEQNVLLITRLTGYEYTNFRTELPGKLENRINGIYLKNEFIHFVRKADYLINVLYAKNNLIKIRVYLSLNLLMTEGKYGLLRIMKNIKQTNYNTVYSK